MSVRVCCSFYVILRGCVSVLINDFLPDNDDNGNRSILALQQQQQQLQPSGGDDTAYDKSLDDLSKLGQHVATLGRLIY